MKWNSDELAPTQFTVGFRLFTANELKVNDTLNSIQIVNTQNPL